MKRALSFAVWVLTFVLWSVNAWAASADYPTKPITIIVPFTPGGTVDFTMRTYASTAEKLLKQPVVVVNKPGATGMIGSLAGAQAAPDGYTLTLGSSAMISTLEWEMIEGRKPPFSRHDFAIIGSLTMMTPMVVVPHDSPWKTLSDLLRDCKAKPEYYSFGSGGLYGGSHLPAEMLMMAAGITARHMPYKGAAISLTALAGKHDDFGTHYTASTIPLVRGKKLRVLAILSDRRLRSLPDVPTAKELGFDVSCAQWSGVLVPKDTPASIVEKLRDITLKVTKEKTFIDLIEATGDEVYFMNHEEVAKYWDKESVMFATLFGKLIEKEKKPSK